MMKPSALLKTLTLILCSFLTAGSLSAKVYDFTTDNKLTLLHDAHKAVALKLEMVKKARHHVHIVTYYWDNAGYPIELMKELAKAHDRGVDVRILTTYIPSVTMDFFGKSKRTLYKGADKKSKAVLSYLKMSPIGNNQSVTNNIHEKIFLVDGEKAIIGGRNISDNDYRAKDLEVLLEGAVVNQAQKHFETMFSFMVMQEINKKCRNAEDDSCEARLNRTTFHDGDKGFYPEQPRFENGVKARILTNEILIQQHQNHYWGEERFHVKDDIIDTLIKTDFEKLRAYNYFIIPTARYKTYLEQKLALGKKIELITNGQETASSISDKGYLYGLPEMHNLMERGMNVYRWQKSQVGEDEIDYLHEKVMLFDDNHAFIGSHNFGSGSTSVSSEIVVEFYSRPLVKELTDIFDSEISDRTKTDVATLSTISSEIHENRYMIKFLHMFYIRNIIRELY